MGPARSRSWRDELLAVASAVGAAFISLSIFSYQINSSALLSGELRRNLMGPVGHTFATLVCGIPWLVLIIAGVFGFIFLAVSAWRGKVDQPTKTKKDATEVALGPVELVLPGLVGVLVGACAISALFWGAGVGGSVGVAISGFLTRLFGRAGAGLVTSAGVLLFLALASRSTVQSVGNSLTKLALTLGIFLFLTIPTVITRITVSLGVILFNLVGQGMATVLSCC